MNVYDVGDIVVVEGTFLSDPVTVTVDTGGAIIGATSVPVVALSGAIPAGTVLTFDTPATATLTATANVGATSLAVSALAAALLAGDEATYPGGPTDPTDVSFQIQPAGSEATVYVYGTDSELTRSSEGAYSAAWLVGVAGVHQYRFIGTGDVQQEEGARFYARPRNVTVSEED